MDNNNNNNNKYAYSPIAVDILEILATLVPEYYIYFMIEDRDIHNFTLTKNWTQVKPLHGSSKQLVSRRNNRHEQSSVS